MGMCTSNCSFLIMALVGLVMRRAYRRVICLLFLMGDRDGVCRAVVTTGLTVSEGAEGKVRVVEGVGLVLLSFRREFLGFERGVNVSSAGDRRGERAGVGE